MDEWVGGFGGGLIVWMGNVSMVCVRCFCVGKVGWEVLVLICGRGFFEYETVMVRAGRNLGEILAFLTSIYFR